MIGGHQTRRSATTSAANPPSIYIVLWRRFTVIPERVIGEQEGADPELHHYLIHLHPLARMPPASLITLLAPVTWRWAGFGSLKVCWDLGGLIQAGLVQLGLGQTQGAAQIGPS